MGLDQRVFIREDTNISDWRKHNRLQGWMEELWREKTGSKEVFNLETLELEFADIERLEKDIMNKNLPVTNGFFFGDDSYVEYEKWHLEDDLKFIKKAKEVLSSGQRIFYSSWW
jgi:hypothetical protein